MAKTLWFPVLKTEQLIQAWQQLHDTGLAYQLQGWFGRTAQNLIAEGIIKTDQNDGYSAVQIGFKFDKKANKPKKNHFTKNKCEPMKYIREFRVDKDSQFSLGEKIDVKIFSEGEYVNISGISKGKGFAGVMKRHGFGGGRASHGKNSVMRKPGSVGAGADPSRIWKGKKMPGRYGGDKVTYKNLEILKIDKENNLLFIKGAVPGSNNRLVSIFI